MSTERLSSPDPFVLESSMSEEENQVFERRRAAIWKYEETGDPTELIALGILPEDAKQTETDLMKQRKAEGL